MLEHAHVVVMICGEAAPTSGTQRHVTLATFVP